MPPILPGQKQRICNFVNDVYSSRVSFHNFTLRNVNIQQGLVCVVDLSLVEMALKKNAISTNQPVAKANHRYFSYYSLKDVLVI